VQAPTQCHLWQADVLRSEDFQDIFEVEQSFQETSHFSRCLLRCTRCGQRYFYQFYETIDWDAGDDPQHSMYVPVDSAEEIETLRRTGLGDLGQFVPRLIKDFPKGTKEPIMFWVGR
jgi:hypothetical protein